MRRWFCVFALVAGFSGTGYAWTARPRTPVPIVRLIDVPSPAVGTRLTAAWWRRP